MSPNGIALGHAARVDDAAGHRRSGAVTRLAEHLRRWYAPAIVSALAVLSIIATAFLQHRAEAYSQAEVKLANVATQFSDVGVHPLQLVDGLVPAPTVGAQMRGGEIAVHDELAGLARNEPLPSLHAIGGPLERDFATVNAIFSLLAHDPQLSDPGSVLVAVHLGVTANAAGGETTNAIDTAKAQYSKSASRAQTQALVGSAVAVTALLAAFLLFYRRAFRARLAAEALADDLGRKEAHLAEAQRQAGVGSWEWDAASGRLIWSEQQARLHHWDADEPPRSLQAMLELVDADSRARLADALRTARAEGGLLSMRYKVTGPDGTRIIDCHGTSVRDTAGRVTGLVGTCQDVTDRFLRAEAERATQAKDEFLSRMSHELRTPLNAILGFSQLLEMGELSDRQHANVDHVLKAGDHLLELVNEVLEISRIQSNPDYVSMQPVRAGSVVSEAIDLVAPMAQARHIVVSVRGEDDDLWVLADVQRLRQVLLNLLSNAIKYNGEGRRVQICLRRGDQERIEIAVLDDGPGIAPELLVRLFTPFDRLGAEQSSIEGTGLGLALSKAFAEAMGGTLGVQSTPGKGSVFTLELAAHAPVAEPAASDRCDVRADDRRLVLCVDDNPANLELIEQIFVERLEITVVSAVQGRMAVDLARRRRPDLLLVDLNLPDIDGEEVVRLLQAEPETARIPFVAISADATAERRAAVLDLGARAYLTKPFDIAELLRIVDEALLAPA